MQKKMAISHYNLLQVIIYFSSVYIITPKSSALYPIIIWFGMLIFSGLIFIFYFNKGKSIAVSVADTKSYKNTLSITLTTSVLFLLTCLSFKTLSSFDIDIPIVLTILTASSVIYSISSHIKEVDGKDQAIKKKSVLIMKYSWVVVSLISYFLARSITSTSWDIPFDSTANKLTILIITLLFVFIFYFFIYFMSLFVLLCNQGVKKRKNTLKFNKSLSIIAPLGFIGYVAYIVFSVQTLSILKFGFELALKYDTRDTFYCNNEYRILIDYPESKFMFISDGNYRAIVPMNNDYYIGRLNCTNNSPYYSLVYVKDKKSLLESYLKQKIKIFTEDLNSVVSKG